jgi:hypothetical protein
MTARSVPLRKRAISTGRWWRPPWRVAANAWHTAPVPTTLGIAAGGAADWGASMPRAHEPVVRYDRHMHALKARVENGRIKLDEPTDLPEGEVELVPLDEVLLNGGDYLDDEERKALHESIREGIEDMKAGRTFDADEVLAELR